jgi:hypothetical protein
VGLIDGAKHPAQVNAQLLRTYANRSH